jgi:hypothetical protein
MIGFHQSLFTSRPRVRACLELSEIILAASLVFAAFFDASALLVDGPKGVLTRTGFGCLTGRIANKSLPVLRLSVLLTGYNQASGHLSFPQFPAFSKRLNHLLKTSVELAKEVDHLSQILLA